MRDFIYNYIPDLTERCPEGFNRTFDEPDYNMDAPAPAYDEVVPTDPYYKNDLVQLLESEPECAYYIMRKSNSKRRLIADFDSDSIRIDNEELIATDIRYKDKLIELLNEDPEYAYYIIHKHNYGKPVYEYSSSAAVNDYDDGDDELPFN